MKRKDGGTHWNRIQKPYEEHSIKKENLSRILLIVFLAYVVCYLLSQTVFHEVYLFEWTAVYGLHLLLSVFWKCIEQLLSQQLETGQEF